MTLRFVAKLVVGSISAFVSPDRNPDAPAIDKGARKLGFEEIDRERVIHDAGCPGRCHRPKARTAIHIKPRDHLIELAAESLWRHRNPNPNGQMPRHGDEVLGPCSSGSPLEGNLALGRSVLPLAEIAPRDLDVAIVGQLSATDLSLGDPFEPSAMQVISFQATFGRWTFVEKGLECATVDAHHAFILTDGNAERDAAPVGVPSSVFRKSEEHRLPLRAMFS
jgi:hypothetical protein